MTMATTTTRPPSRWSIMKAHIARTALGTFRAYLEMSPRPHLGPPRILWMGIGEGSGESPRLPITNCLSATPLSVGAFATKVNTGKRARNAARSPEDGWAPTKKVTRGAKRAAALHSIRPSFYFYTLFLRGFVASSIAGNKCRNQVGRAS